MKSQKSNGVKHCKGKADRQFIFKCAAVGVTVFLLYLCILYWKTAASFVSGAIGAASPLIIGCIVAYPLNILMSFYEKYWFPNSEKKVLIKLRRPLCMVFAIVTLLAITALVVGLVLPQFIACVKLIIDAFPDAMDATARFLQKHHFITEKAFGYVSGIDWEAWLGKAVSVLTSGIGSVVEVVFATVSSVFSGIVTAFLSIIFAVYVLAGKEKLGSQVDRLMKHYIKPKWYVKVKYVLSVFNDSFRKYIVGQCLEAVILGVLCMVGMLILRLPYATMISALIALTALVPIAGAYIGGGVGAFLILMESPVKALIFVIYLVILQQIEGDVIYPKVVGNSIGLPGIWVLAAVTVGGGIMGVGGMLLGVPIAAALYRLLRSELNGNGLSKQGTAADDHSKAEAEPGEEQQKA